MLTDQSYHRVGGQRPVKVDVRVLSATSRNLADEIAAGRFREDLFYRLNVVPVRLPPLRERREDIPELVSHFLARFAAERRIPTPELSDEAMAALQAHDWPGNVRQLRNIIERTLILAPGDRVGCIEVDLLPPEILDNQGAVGVVERDAWRSWAARCARRAKASSANICKIQIRRFSGNISRTASFIGMERSALHRKLKALGHRRQARRRGVGTPQWPSKPLSLQDHFLNSVRRAKSPVTIFLVKGVKLQGVITWFDAFSLLLRRDGSVAAGLQAFDLDDHAGAARRPTSSRPAARRAMARRPTLQDLFLARRRARDTSR